jgi:hypothetical protein
MPGSYELINYGLRPAKSIERKMLSEATRRLAQFGPLEDLTYIGFGSTYFSDFSLFHKSLGIHRMVSVEKDVVNERRFDFNKPFRCIDLRPGHSNAVLPTLVWNQRTVAWLDYDDQLDTQALADVRFICMNVYPGSFLIVSVNAHPDGYDEHNPRLPQLIERVGEEKIPNGIAEKDLAAWGTASISRRIITNEIRETLIERNGALPFEKQVLYKQLFYFQYADGAKMVTAGGLFYEREQTPIVARCNFESLPFLRTNQRPSCKPCMIEVPNLTYKEIRYLNTQLPRKKGSHVNSPKVPSRDVKKYEALYRYFPQFAETEI